MSCFQHQQKNYSYFCKFQKNLTKHTYVCCLLDFNMGSLYRSAYNGSISYKDKVRQQVSGKFPNSRSFVQCKTFKLQGVRQHFRILACIAAFRGKYKHLVAYNNILTLWLVWEKNVHETYFRDVYLNYKLFAEFRNTFLIMKASNTQHENKKINLFCKFNLYIVLNV